MKKLIIILSIDFIVAGFILFLVVQPVKQTPKWGDGILHGYVYAELRSNDKNIEQVYLPGVLVTIKDANGATADIVKSKPDGSYSTKQLKFGIYKIYLYKTGFPVSAYNAVVGNSTNNTNPLKLNVDNSNYSWEKIKAKEASADY